MKPVALRITYVIRDAHKRVHGKLWLGRVTMAYCGERSYYSHRADEEIRCGDTASNVAAAIVHYELAYRYSLKAAESIASVPELTFVKGSRTESFVPNFPTAAPRLVVVPSEATG